MCRIALRTCPKAFRYVRLSLRPNRGLCDPQPMAWGHAAQEIIIPKVSVTGLGDHAQNVGCATDTLTYQFEPMTFYAMPHST